ncbi:MAG: aspartate--tRNA ligase [Clostridiales bacterium]|jgi:aspartyl-tRNA synthetase|nr:aspartate--tRNA ligase [Clostridiales bacterium]
MENLGKYRRTFYCGEFGQAAADAPVVAVGWVNRVRRLGQLVFVTLRDHTGLVQIALDEAANPALFAKAEGLKSEYVVAVAGKIALRREKDINPDMATGKIEIIAEELAILSNSALPPFQIGDDSVSEALRLKHRYLDLRRDALQYNLRLRHSVTMATRNFLSNRGFIEVETPILTNSAPEGARDYLVPSRAQPGKFYALPQSPQVLKQILMVSSIDKYFQIAKCLRDEDLRADRQPEFTQIDIEQAFIDQDDVLALTEDLIIEIFKNAAGIDLPKPFPRMSHAEAMSRFGSDKPDTRFGLELVDISGIVAGSEFAVFENALAAGGSVRGINAAGCATLSRKQIDSLVEHVKTYKAKGLAWIQLLGGEVKTTISKFFSPEKLAEIVAAFDAKDGDLILICADENTTVFDALGHLRLEIARRQDLIPEGLYHPLWILEFPLLIWDAEDGRYYANHHPFTAPRDEDLHLLDADPAAARSKQHDLVINGYEAGGGSIRIHREDVQQKMFEVLSYSKEEIYANFSHLMEAFRYGAPPHGGIALGLDRLVMLMAKTANIRDVIAFPKQQDGSCPLTGAPNTVFPQQLDELKIKLLV